MTYPPLLLFHIGAGTTGLVSGAVSLSFRKGSRGHRAAGNVFFVSMRCMASAGIVLALMKSQMSNVFGGTLTFYLVATAWSIVGATIATFGMEAARSPSGSKDNVPAPMYFVLASVALLAAAGDIRMLARVRCARKGLAEHYQVTNRLVPAATDPHRPILAGSRDLQTSPAQYASRVPRALRGRHSCLPPR